MIPEGTTATFLFGIMKATVMLDEYVKAEWIKHPAISATIVLASLQKDGKGKNAVAGIVAEHTTTLVQLTQSVAAVKNSGKAVHEELKQLKAKNPNLNS